MKTFVLDPVQRKDENPWGPRHRNPWQASGRARRQSANTLSPDYDRRTWTKRAAPLATVAVSCVAAWSLLGGREAASLPGLQTDRRARGASHDGYHQTFGAAASYAATGRGRAGLAPVGIDAMILPPRKRGVTQRRRTGGEAGRGSGKIVGHAQRVLERAFAFEVGAEAVHEFFAEHPDFRLFFGHKLSNFFQPLLGLGVALEAFDFG